MAEHTTERPARARRVRHSGRGGQVLIYLGKQLRFFINENDWKVLPMAAIIAGLVGMVIRKRLFITMEGTLIGAFALVCVAIWNGSFNSIQSVCRERAIIKREHRSGLHISSYVTAHMIYQLLLCLMQTGLTMYVLRLTGVQFPKEGFMTPWMIVDVGISMLLISYAADMMSLFLSSISRTTTGAMTLMPFVLIFQLVFSGGIIPLPAWSQNLSYFTVSNYGVKVIAAQAGYNELPMATGWNTLESMRAREVGGTFTLGQVLDLLNSPSMEGKRDTEVLPAMRVSDVLSDLLAGQNETDRSLALSLAEMATGDTNAMTSPVSLGQLIDFANSSEAIQAKRDQTFTFQTTVGELLNTFGEEKIRAAVEEATAEAARKPEYDRTEDNVIENWFMLGFFILLFAMLSMIALELIDKDKR